VFRRACKVNVDLSKQRAFVIPATPIDKGDVFIKKYDGNGEDSRKLYLIIQETINLPNDEKAVKRLRDPKKVVVITTTKWLLVARLQPQKPEKIMQIQANQIWAEAEKLLDDKDPRKFDAIIWWSLTANEQEVANLKLHADVNPIQDEERRKVYSRTFENGADKIGRYHNFIFEEAHYFRGKGPGPGDQMVYHRSQVVIHDHKPFLGVAKYEKLKITMYYNSYKKIEPNGLRFPMVSLMVQDSCNDIFNPGILRQTWHTRVYFGMTASNNYDS